jgi:death-on-curing protein
MASPTRRRWRPPMPMGNKRTAAVVSETFLMLNGYQLAASDAELVVAFLDLAAGDLSEEELADWFREHLASD